MAASTRTTVTVPDRRHWRRLSIWSLLLVVQAMTAAASAQTSGTPPTGDYYRGKTVTVLVGFSVGGGFDLYARALARHIGRQLPGWPTVVVQNMPGAGSIKAVEYLLAAAPRDGTMLATFSHTVPIEPLLGHASFDPRRFAWLGSMASETSLCVARQTSEARSLDDLRGRRLSFGGTGRGSDTDMYANYLAVELHLPLRLVTGYPGTSELELATERGEIDGFCGISYSALKTRHADWLASKRVNIIVQAGLVADPELPDIPMLLDYARSDAERMILQLLIVPQAMARPFALPPGTPENRVATVRAAFEATLADPLFRADAEKAGLTIDAVTAGRIEALLDGLYGTPPDILRRAVVALGG